MAKTPVKILILCHESIVLAQIKKLLTLQGPFELIKPAPRRRTSREQSIEPRPDVVIAETSKIDPNWESKISSIRKSYGKAKILALSYSLDSRQVLRTIHAGANGYLILDRAAEELVPAIRTVAAGGMYLSPGIAGLTGRRPS
jgi:DNA-binding NarL/FixJ family response regulator